MLKATRIYLEQTKNRRSREPRGPKTFVSHCTYRCVLAYLFLVGCKENLAFVFLMFLDPVARIGGPFALTAILLINFAEKSVRSI